MSFLYTLADLSLNIPPKPRNSVAEEVLFHNRIRDDLPAEIKGRAFWTEGANSNFSSYRLNLGTHQIAIEFINGKWYHIHWQGPSIGQGKYVTSVDDEIPNPRTYGLETRSVLFLLAIDTTRIHHEPSESSPEQEITFASPHTDEDFPTTDVLEERTITDLSNTMAATQINTMMIPIQQQQQQQFGGPANPAQPPTQPPAQPPAAGGGSSGGGGGSGGGGRGGGRAGGGGSGGIPAAPQSAQPAPFQYQPI